MRYADDFPLRDQQVTTKKTGTAGRGVLEVAPI
jgi:hypothetical protein